MISFWATAHRDALDMHQNLEAVHSESLKRTSKELLLKATKKATEHPASSHMPAFKQHFFTVMQFSILQNLPCKSIYLGDFGLLTEYAALTVTWL